MLSSEFNQEMGAMVRSLEGRIRQDPQLIHTDLDDAIKGLEDTIVSLVAARLQLVKIRDASRER